MRVAPPRPIKKVIDATDEQRVVEELLLVREQISKQRKAESMVNRYIKNSRWETVGSDAELHRLFVNERYVAAFQKRAGASNTYDFVILDPTGGSGNILKTFVNSSGSTEDVRTNAEKIYANVLVNKLLEAKEVLAKLEQLTKEAGLESNLVSPKDEQTLSVRICCETCHWYCHEEIDGGYVCTNGDSEHVADWVEPDFCCEEYEEK